MSFNSTHTCRKLVQALILTLYYFSICPFVGCVADVADNDGFVFNSMFGKKTLRKSSQAVVVGKNLDCREICAVAGVVDYRQAAESKQWPLAEESGFLFPSVLQGGEKRELALTPAKMTTNLQIHLRTASMKDKLYTMHPFRVGGAASHSMDGVALDVLMEYMGSEVRNRRTQICMLGVTASVAAGGVKLSCETAFIEAAALPLSEQFARSYAAFPWRNRSRAH